MAVKMTYGEMVAKFREHERDNPSTHLAGFIVFTEDSFLEPYSLESRTYEVSSNNKAYRPSMSGYSIFGTSLDGADYGIRLDRYMAAEKGGANGWQVDYCYMEEGS